jgi:hypothetical protein
MNHIGMVFQKADGSSLAPADLAPLMVPTNDMLQLVAKQTGKVIRPDTLTGALRAFPAVALSDKVMLHSRALMESSNDPSIAKLLADFRRAEYQRLFGGVKAAQNGDVSRLLESARTNRAAKIIVTILNGATAFAAGGSEFIDGEGYRVRFGRLQSA